METKLLVGSNAKLSALKCVLLSGNSRINIKLKSSGNGVFSSDLFQVNYGDTLNLNFWGRLGAGWAIKLEEDEFVVTPNEYISGNFGDIGPYEVTKGNIVASFNFIQTRIAL